MNDIILDSSYNFLVKNGDFLADHSHSQHIEQLLISEKGQWKQYPLVGVGIRSLLLDEASLVSIRKDIQEQLETDGATVEKIDFSPTGFNVAADY